MGDFDSEIYESVSKITFEVEYELHLIREACMDTNHKLDLIDVGLDRVATAAESILLTLDQILGELQNR